MCLAPDATCIYQKKSAKKWDKKGKRGVFVGYSDNLDGFHIWLKSENHIIRSKDVVFEPETAGRLLTLFPSETNNDAQAEKQKSESDSVKSASESSPELAPDSSETQTWETPVSSTIKRQLRDRQNLQAPKRPIETMSAEVDDLRNYSEAMKSAEKEHWIAAMKEEMAPLKENSTWDELPAGRKAITNRWIYRIKRNVNGKIIRYKVRPVVRGFN